MLNRRLIRVKVFQTLYAHVQDDQPSLNKSTAYLKDSITGIHRNFMTVFLFPLALVHHIRTNKNPAEQKLVQDEQMKRKYEALSLNGLYEFILRQPAIKTAVKHPSHNWQLDSSLLNHVYRHTLDHEALEKLVSSDYSDFNAQLKFLNRLYTVLSQYDEFDQAMEEIEMLWEDEKIPIFKAIRNTFSEVKQDGELPVPQTDEKDEEGLQYAEELLTLASRNLQEYGDMIDVNSPGWDRDRIAKADMILMTLALTELIHFPYIPIKVTLNEYLELAKNYSTPQSSKFVNGVLDKMVRQLKEKDMLIKKGRGMVE